MHDDCSKSVITVKIDDIKKGSAGIMMRSTDSQSSANVHLEATATGDLFVFFRQKEVVPLTDEWGILVFLLR